jgi:uncharacterized membrane protein
MLEEWIRAITLNTSLVVEGVSALIVAYAVGEAIVRLIAAISLHSGRSPAQASHTVKEEIRLRLGRWLAVALELLLGADILRTAVAPTWSEIGQLAAIATIRTALNFFLQREIDVEQARRSDQRADHGCRDGLGTATDRAAS